MDAIPYSESARQRLNWRHFGKFAVLWIIMTFVNTFLMTTAERHFGLRLTWLVKLPTEAMLATVNFFLCRHVVYR
jgi:hypothetical protein